MWDGSSRAGRTFFSLLGNVPTLDFCKGGAKLEKLGLAGADVGPSAAVSARMRTHPRRDTGPELELRRALHAAGMRFRVQCPVPGLPRRTIDVAFTRQRLAVFVDGCFWHGCAEHRSSPTTNSTFWRTKLAGNAARDADTVRHLLAVGWRSVRVWEHESVSDAVDRVRQALAV